MGEFRVPPRYFQNYPNLETLLRTNTILLRPVAGHSPEGEKLQFENDIGSILSVHVKNSVSDGNFDVICKENSIPCWAISQDASRLHNIFSVLKKYDLKIQRFTTRYSLLTAWTPFGYKIGIYDSNKSCGRSLYRADEKPSSLFEVEKTGEGNIGTIKASSDNIRLEFQSQDEGRPLTEDEIGDRMLFIALALVISDRQREEIILKFGWSHRNKTITILLICFTLVLVIALCCRYGIMSL